MTFDRDKLAARYHELCDARDAKLAEVAHLRDALDAANARALAAQGEARELALRIGGAKGGADWLALKKEIADIARFFGRVPPRPAAPETPA